MALGMSLHTMAVLQVYQAEVLKDMEMRQLGSCGRPLTWCYQALIAAERHLWLTLTDIKDKLSSWMLLYPGQAY